MSSKADAIRRKNRRGKHLSASERYYIEVEHSKGTRIAEIAESINRPRETIYREIKRGSVLQRRDTSSDIRCEMVYFADAAQRRAAYNQQRKGSDLKIGSNKELAADIERWIVKEKNSPYAALVNLQKVDGWMADELFSVKTFYNYVHAGVLGITMEDLPMKGKQRKRDAKKYRHAHQNVRGKSIELRPDEVKDRLEFGHWEGDFIIGAQGTRTVVLTLVERKTRMLITARFNSKEAKNVVGFIDRLEARYGTTFPKLFKTITWDNGTEFSDFEGMERSRYKSRQDASRVEVYYAHPYCSSERGSNECMNKMLRRFVPKGTDIGKVSKDKLRKSTEWINAYPRAILRGESASALFARELALLEQREGCMAQAS